jgi:hypothetical protein
MGDFPVGSEIRDTQVIIRTSNMNVTYYRIVNLTDPGGLQSRHGRGQTMENKALQILANEMPSFLNLY